MVDAAAGPVDIAALDRGRGEEAHATRHIASAAEAIRFKVIVCGENGEPRLSHRDWRYASIRGLVSFPMGAQRGRTVMSLRAARPETKQRPICSTPSTARCSRKATLRMTMGLRPSSPTVMTRPGDVTSHAPSRRPAIMSTIPRVLPVTTARCTTETPTVFSSSLSRLGTTTGSSCRLRAGRSLTPEQGLATQNRRRPGCDGGVW